MTEYKTDLPGPLLKQGAEARVYTGQFLGKPCVVKERFTKKYRHPTLDMSLTQQRTKSEVRSMMRCRGIGIKTPAVYFVDLARATIYMELVENSMTVRDHINSVLADPALDNLATLGPLARAIGAIIGKLHANNIIHGDLTTSNMLLRAAVSQGAGQAAQRGALPSCAANIIANPKAAKIARVEPGLDGCKGDAANSGGSGEGNSEHRDIETTGCGVTGPRVCEAPGQEAEVTSTPSPDVVLLDFGLGYVDSLAEDKGVDLYVLERALLSTHPNTEALFSHLLTAYTKAYGAGASDVISKLEEVRLRGRKRTMVG